jgi:hypothetical protein
MTIHHTTRGVPMTAKTLPRCTCDACARCLTDEQAAATREARRWAVRRMVRARKEGRPEAVQWAIDDYRWQRAGILGC